MKDLPKLIASKTRQRMGKGPENVEVCWSETSVVIRLKGALLPFEVQLAQKDKNQELLYGLRNLCGELLVRDFEELFKPYDITLQSYRQEVDFCQNVITFYLHLSKGTRCETALEM